MGVIFCDMMLDIDTDFLLINVLLEVMMVHFLMHSVAQS